MFDASTSLYAEDDPGYLFLRHSERTLTGEDQCRLYGCYDRDWYLRRPKPVSQPTPPGPTQLRHKLRAAGFAPLPLFGKEPPIYGRNNKNKGLGGWQDLHEVTAAQIDLWEKTWPGANNTGALTQRMPTIDIDITFAEAAEAVEALAREWFEDKGRMLIRVGLAPKRAILLRTDVPFKKIITQFIAPSDIVHKIEILANGQQVVVAGIHPDTGHSYTWHGGVPWEVPRAELPYVNDDMARAFMTAATKLLVERFGFMVTAAPTPGKAKGNDPNAFEQFGDEQRASNPKASPELVAAALAVIPNIGVSWDEWNNIGMATWRATDGDGAGFAAFDAWSQRAVGKYNAHTTAERWAHYFKSPPNQIGAGSLFFRANEASPGWREAYEEPQPQPQPQPEPEPQPDEFSFKWHGDVDPNDSRPWLVRDLIPEVGSGLVSGQWGTYKTFMVLDLGHSVMTGTTFLDFEVMRPGGVLFIALEGANEVAIRLQGVIDHKGKLTKAPFVWIETCPPLINKNAVSVLSRMAERAAAQLRERFDLPLSAIFIDTVVAGAGYTKDGQENDAASNQAMMRTLAQVARNAGCFVFGVDHFGKNVDTGTRGSSTKEAAADVVLVLLGEKNVAGEISNTRLAIRKRRGGSNGAEFPFKPRVVDMGTDKFGVQITTLVLDWGATNAAPKAAKDDWGSGKGLKLLRQAMMGLLVDCGVEIRPWAEGPTVRALDAELVRAEFYKGYFAEGVTPVAKQTARRQAFHRAVATATDKGVVVTRLVGEKTFIWLAVGGHDEGGLAK
jgi:hypothetical protein